MLQYYLFMIFKTHDQVIIDVFRPNELCSEHVGKLLTDRMPCRLVVRFSNAI